MVVGSLRTINARLALRFWPHMGALTEYQRSVIRFEL
jgi:hypothetical protein